MISNGIINTRITLRSRRRSPLNQEIPAIKILDRRLFTSPLKIPVFKTGPEYALRFHRPKPSLEGFAHFTYQNQPDQNWSWRRGYVRWLRSAPRTLCTLRALMTKALHCLIFILRRLAPSDGATGPRLYRLEFRCTPSAGANPPLQDNKSGFPALIDVWRYTSLTS